ncbi:MAG: hypothetical protein PHX51_07360 [Clostridia bacterium]|nr:hypothetical protein [Clostridia bacterium]
MLSLRVAKGKKTDEVLSHFLSGSSLSAYEENADGNEDTKPSIETMRYMGVEGGVKTRRRVSKTEKILAVGYLVLVAALIVVIMYASGVATANASTIDKLKSEATALSSNINDVDSSIESTMRSENIEAKAIELGLAYPSGGQVVYTVAPEQKGPITYTTEKNWFDDVCDFFANIFGGK